MITLVATIIAVSVLLVAVTQWVAAVPIAVLVVTYVPLVTIVWKAHGIIRRWWKRMNMRWVVPMTVQSLLIAAALHACFLSYAVLKEMLVTQDHIASPVLVLSSRLMSVICSSTYLLVTEGEIKFGAPLRSMSFFAFTNEASTWAGYEVLKYVSFPIQVMAKSVRMLPNMLMGKLLRGRCYPVYQYVQAVVASVCVGIMHFADGQQTTNELGQAVRQKAPDAKGAMDPGYKLCMGVAMLITFFVCDSFTSQWQTALYEKHPRLTQTHMMLGGNLLGLLLTSSTLVASWPRVVESLVILQDTPNIMTRVLALGGVSALGQFCIYSAIKILGPLSFAWIMTARQLLSVLISLSLFGHGLSLPRLACILVVFGIMSAKQLSKLPEKMDEMGQLVRKNSRDFLEQFARRRSPFSACSREDFTG